MVRKVEFYLFYMKVKYECIEMKKVLFFYLFFKCICKKELNDLLN